MGVPEMSLRVAGCTAIGVLLAAVGLAHTSQRSVIVNGFLNWIQLEAESLPESAPVIVHLFDSSQADLGHGKEGGKERKVEAAQTIQKDGPKILAESLIKKLSTSTPFADVRLYEEGEADEAAIIVQGRFTIIDPGARKAALGGFGARPTTIEIEGTVRNSSNEVLATFRQKRLGLTGLNSRSFVKPMRSDCVTIGEDIAVFLGGWANGKDLTQEPY